MTGRHAAPVVVPPFTWWGFRTGLVLHARVGDEARFACTKPVGDAQPASVGRKCSRCCAVLTGGARTG